MFEIHFVKTHVDAQLPFKKNRRGMIENGDAGFDLIAVEDTIIPATSVAGEVEVAIGNAVVPVGLKLGYLTPGWWLRIESRSSMGFVKGIEAFNGIIDNQYRGDLGVKLKNLTAKDFLVKKGDRIAQIVPYINQDFDIKFVEEAVQSDRGANGFGSTGR